VQDAALRVEHDELPFEVVDRRRGLEHDRHVPVSGAIGIRNMSTRSSAETWPITRLTAAKGRTWALAGESFAMPVSRTRPSR
jgi:hypothetical protein